MDNRLLPATPSGKLDRLVEECAEVIKAVQKGRRFGWTQHTYDGVAYDNATELEEELKDLEHAISSVRCVLKGL